MTEKRFELTFMDCFYITDHQTKDYASVLEEDLEEIVDLLNKLNDENEQLKHDATVLIQANQDYRKENEKLKQQLFYDGDGVCDICKHEYLTPSGDYFISNCRKGHEECSKEDLRYCKDFEVKELKE
jgi:hypothetical protein